MERIIQGNVLAPNSMVEYVAFSSERPYTISVKTFSHEDITIPHYGDFFEIILCVDLVGTLVLSSCHFPLADGLAYIIPPKCVHSTFVQQGTGCMYVIKLPVSFLKHLVNVENILRTCGKSTKLASFQIPDTAKLRGVVENLIALDEDPILRLGEILRLISCIAPCFQPLQNETVYKERDTEPLLQIIDWTEKNLNAAIHVEDAANVVGYSKHYFCRWFKANTSFTYGEYVQRIRVDRACRYLLDGHSVAETSRLCGYENTSYFIRIFTRYLQCTPKEYRQSSFHLEKSLP